MEKLELLRQRLREWKDVAIAYSGGVDSHFLACAAEDVLGKEHVLAVLCHGAMMAEEDYREAAGLLEERGIPYQVVDIDVFEVPQFACNDKLRCYYCKKRLMSAVWEEARKRGFETVLDGKNLDDSRVYRPGARAAKELGVISPLYECGFTKQEIRGESKNMRLPTWGKPSNACLASRFPYGAHLTGEKLRQVEKAEAYLRETGVVSGRVRVHGGLARIEVGREEFTRILEDRGFVDNIKGCGFDFVALDLEGFRSGSFD